MTHKVGFTLAEVLITLGIIGIVAAITIPNLIMTQKAHRLRSQFLKSYSVIQQAFRQMEDDGVLLDMKSTRTNYKTIMGYFNGATYCGTNGSKCFNKSIIDLYKTFSGADSSLTWQGSRILDDGQILLPDGSLIFLEDVTNKTWISIYLNGYNNPPNKFGYDLFTFQYEEGILTTMGSRNTVFTDIEKYCNIKSNDTLNGIACAHKAKTETDYFKWVVKNVK